MKLSFVLIFLCMLGCNHVQTKKPKANDTNTLAKTLTITGKSQYNASADTTGQELSDSARLIPMMPGIMRYAYAHRTAGSYTKKLAIWNASAMWATVTFGNIFDKNKKHLIVRRSVSGSVIMVNVFVLKNDRFYSVCSQALDNFTYMNDIIKDVNGDGQPDLLIHWYPSSGCCRRNVFDVYLYRPDQGSLSTQYEFMNPTFSAPEKIVRGVTYGYECELYKYKWRGTKVDTLEYIVADTALRKFRVFRNEDDADNFYDESAENKKPGKIIADVPEEFMKIDDYDWFDMSLAFRRSKSK